MKNKASLNLSLICISCLTYLWLLPTGGATRIWLMTWLAVLLMVAVSTAFVAYLDRTIPEQLVDLLLNLIILVLCIVEATILGQDSWLAYLLIPIMLYMIADSITICHSRRWR